MGDIWGLWQSCSLFIEGITVLAWGVFWTGWLPTCWCDCWFLYVSLELRCGCPGTVLDVMAAGSMPEEGVGTMGVAGTAGLLLAGGKVLDKLDGTLWCLLKVQSWLMLSIFVFACWDYAGIISFKVWTFELIDLPFLNFAVPVFLYFVYE